MFMLPMLTNEQIKMNCEQIKNGVLFRLGYRTEVPLKASVSKQGFKLIKFTEQTVRMGVSYFNLKAVKERESSRDSSNRTNNFEWVIKNKLKRHNDTGKQYLQVAPIKHGGNKKSLYYFSNDSEILHLNENQAKALMEEICNPSYLNKKNSEPTVFTVNTDNIFLMENKSVSFYNIGMGLEFLD